MLCVAKETLQIHGEAFDIEGVDLEALELLFRVAKATVSEHLVGSVGRSRLEPAGLPQREAAGGAVRQLHVTSDLVCMQLHSNTFSESLM